MVWDPKTRWLIWDSSKPADREEMRPPLDWCNPNDLVMNDDKTKELILDFRGNQHSPTQLLLNNTAVEGN